MATTANESEVRIVVAHLGPFPLESSDNGKRRRLSKVIDVLLVSHAQHQYLRAIHGLPASIEGLGDRTNNMVGHLHVDLTHKLNEPRLEVEFLGLP